VVKSPIAAVSAERLSIFAVPSIYKSLNSAPEEPKSLVPSASGNISPLTVNPAPTLAPAPTYSCFSIPTPPANLAAPVVEL